MKERFAKLLLGEDMSGGGKGVCTAVTISNAITNLYGNFFFLYQKEITIVERIFVAHCLRLRGLALCICATFCSYRIRAEIEIRASESREEGNVEKRNGLSTFGLWLYGRSHRFHTGTTRWDIGSGEGKNNLKLPFYKFTICTPFLLQHDFVNALQVMTSRPRSDIYVNLPALQKLDAMLSVRRRIL